MAKILVLNGPNLNLLGTREPHLYGNETLSSLHNQLNDVASSLGHELFFYQSNAEYELINKIQESTKNRIDFMIINPAAYTHTSIALRDALIAVAIPFIETHISNIFARESFRHFSYLSDIARGVIVGLGTQGYILALHAAHTFLSLHKK